MLTIAAMIIVLAGGFISGVAGFGFALAVVPLLLLLYDPPTVTATAICLTLLIGWIVLLGSWRKVEVRTVLMLLPGAIIGLLIGVNLIDIVQPAVIKLVAALVVLLFSLSLLRGWKMQGVHSPLAPPLAGLFSGMLNATTGMAGPPVALLFTTRDYGIDAFRASIVAYFYVIDLLAIVLLTRRQIVTTDDLRTVALLMPAAIVGSFLGRRAVKRISPLFFRRITLVMLVITGLIGTVAAVVALAEG